MPIVVIVLKRDQTIKRSCERCGIEHLVICMSIGLRVKRQCTICVLSSAQQCKTMTTQLVRVREKTGLGSLRRTQRPALGIAAGPAIPDFASPYSERNVQHALLSHRNHPRHVVRYCVIRLIDSAHTQPRGPLPTCTSTKLFTRLRRRVSLSIVSIRCWHASRPHTAPSAATCLTKYRYPCSC